MITADDFYINDNKIVFKEDEYPLARIKGVRVKTNSLTDHAIRIVAFSLMVSSVVWIICPEYFGLITAPIAIVIGVLLALSTARKYELQVEFQHADDTGLQWVSMAKTNKPNIKMIFEKQVMQILKKLHKKADEILLPR